MALRSRSLIAVVTCVVACLASWLLSGDVIVSVAAGLLIAAPVFIASGLRHRSSGGSSV